MKSDFYLAMFPLLANLYLELADAQTFSYEN